MNGKSSKNGKDNNLHFKKGIEVLHKKQKGQD